MALVAYDSSDDSGSGDGGLVAYADSAKKKVGSTVCTLAGVEVRFFS